RARPDRVSRALSGVSGSYVPPVRIGSDVGALEPEAGSSVTATTSPAPTGALRTIVNRPPEPLTPAAVGCCPLITQASHAFARGDPAGGPRAPRPPRPPRTTPLRTGPARARTDRRSRDAPPQKPSRHPRAHRARRRADLRAGDECGRCSSLVHQTLAELRHPKTHPTLHGAERRVRTRRDLGLRVPAPERERERIALFGGQLRDGLTNALFAKRIDHPLVDPSVSDDVGGGVDAHLALRPLPARAAPVDRGVPTYGEEPGADRATLGPVGSRPPPDSMESIVCDLFCGLRARKHSVEHP